MPLAALVAGEVEIFPELDERQRAQARQMLIRKAPGQVLQFQAS